MGLLAHQMGVFVGVDVELLVKADAPVIHGVDVLRGFGEKIKFVGNQHEREIQSVENVDERLLGR